MTKTKAERKKADKLAALAQLAQRAEFARREVETAVRIAHASGASLRDTAKAAGMSHESVRRIVQSAD